MACTSYPTTAMHPARNEPRNTEAWLDSRANRDSAKKGLKGIGL
jgi:hypothetical protein